MHKKIKKQHEEALLDSFCFVQVTAYTAQSLKREFKDFIRVTKSDAADDAADRYDAMLITPYAITYFHSSPTMS